MNVSVQTTGAIGIHQSDIIIHSALVEAIRDLRANPWLLEYCFAGLAQDALTSQLYGEKQIEIAKDWFLRTNIPVVLNISADDADYPCISVALAESNEAEATLADLHYDVTEDNNDSWPVLYGPFSPLSYTPSSGIMVLPPAVATLLVLAAGQLLVTATGTSYAIEEVRDRQTIVLAEGTVAEFANATIRGTRPSQVTHLESIEFKETYSIGCHVQTDINHLIYLHSLLVFCLLRYKQSLLEARNFERTVINSSPPKVEFEEATVERFYSRYISVSGYVRQIWPKVLSPKITAVEVQPQIIDAGSIVVTAQLPNAPFVGDLDVSLVDSFGNVIA